MLNIMQIAVFFILNDIRAGKNSIGVAILLLLGLRNTIIGNPWTTWAILLILKSGAIVLQY